MNTEEINMNIMANRIKILRKSRKMTQTYLATELGISQESISKYENWKSKPSPKNLVKLADYFNTSIDYILGKTDNILPFQYSSSITKREERENRMFYYFRLLSAEKQEYIIKYIKDLCNKDFI